MKISLQINGMARGEIDDELSDEAILALVSLKVVRVPEKLVNITVNLTDRLREITRIKRWVTADGQDHVTIEKFQQTT